MKINSITLFNPQLKQENNNYKNIKYSTSDITQDSFEKTTQTKPQNISFGNKITNIDNLINKINIFSLIRMPAEERIQFAESIITEFKNLANGKNIKTIEVEKGQPFVYFKDNTTISIYRKPWEIGRWDFFIEKDINSNTYTLETSQGSIRFNSERINCDSEMSSG